MIYQRYIPPLVVLGSLAVASAFGALMIEQLRAKQKRRLQAAVVGWEGEGGSLPKVDGGAP